MDRIIKNFLLFSVDHIDVYYAQLKIKRKQKHEIHHRCQEIKQLASDETENKIRKPTDQKVFHVIHQNKNNSYYKLTNDDFNRVLI